MFLIINCLIRSRVVEYFAGVKSIARGARRENMRSASFELKDCRYDDEQNFLTHSGFTLALQLSRRLERRHGLQWWAPVCSTWVFMNLGTSVRSEFNWEGNSAIEDVAAANTMVWRMCLIILPSISVGCAFIIEQPASSLMQWHPGMLMLKRYCRAQNGGPFGVTSTWLGMFGDETSKQVKCYSNWMRTRRLRMFHVVECNL